MLRIRNGSDERSYDVEKNNMKMIKSEVRITSYA